jgi:hypothetical protein
LANSKNRLFSEGNYRASNILRIQVVSEAKIEMSKIMYLYSIYM